MKDTVIKEKNVKIPLYVTVYETISQWLKEGKYKPGDKLPGENILSEQLNVSRGTLRQAMLLLQEDALSPTSREEETSSFPIRTSASPDWKKSVIQSWISAFSLWTGWKLLSASSRPPRSTRRF